MARFRRPIGSWTWTCPRSSDEPVTADLAALGQAMAAPGTCFEPRTLRAIGGPHTSGDARRADVLALAREVLEPRGDVLLHLGGALRLRTEGGRTRFVRDAAALIVGDGFVVLECWVDDILPAALDATPHPQLHAANAPALAAAWAALAKAFGHKPEGEPDDWATATPTGATNMRSVTGEIFVPPWRFTA